MRFVEYIGKFVKGLSTETIGVLKITPPLKRSVTENGLLNVVLVLQPQLQMKEIGYNTLIYSWDANHMLPIFKHSNEVMEEKH